MSTIRKLSRAQLRPLAMRLLKEQGGLCPCCSKPIDMTIKGEAVVDHSHVTGQVRGILHRSCNAALGKMEHAVGRWGSKSMDYAAIINWINNALVYYAQPEHPFIYPTHVTPEEARVLRNAKERKARATRKARQVVRRSHDNLG